MASSNPEPFPLLNTITSRLASDSKSSSRRRKSSLQGDVRVTRSAARKGDGKGYAVAQLEKVKEEEGGLQRFKTIALKYTWSLPLALLIAILSLYAINPSESNPLHHFIFLSYKLPLEPSADPESQTQYGKGLWDIAFVAFYIIVLSFTREFIMQQFLRPLARRCSVPRVKEARFMEQAYTALYFAILGPAGLYVMSRSPVWYFNILGMYENFPHRTHEALFKFYYLFQGAYWAQQAIVLLLGLEAPRKDFKELVAHHIATLSLIAASYRFHFTYMGIAVYLSHDISDCVLSASPLLLSPGTGRC